MKIHFLDTNKSRTPCGKSGALVAVQGNVSFTRRGTTCVACRRKLDGRRKQNKEKP